MPEMCLQAVVVRKRSHLTNLIQVFISFLNLTESCTGILFYYHTLD